MFIYYEIDRIPHHENNILSESRHLSNLLRMVNQKGSEAFGANPKKSNNQKKEPTVPRQKSQNRTRSIDRHIRSNQKSRPTTVTIKSISIILPEFVELNDMPTRSLRWIKRWFPNVRLPTYAQEMFKVLKKPIVEVQAIRPPFETQPAAIQTLILFYG